MCKSPRGAETDDETDTRHSEGRSPETACGKEPQLRAPVWSSGVPFYPPSGRLWRIGGKWYDFEPFLRLHPGGAEVVRLARDRFEDATFAFESHHHNYARARAIIAKYEVPAPSALMQRPPGAVVPGAGGDGGIDKLPELLGDDAFYSTLRRRLTEYLRDVGDPTGGPTRGCCILFWCNFVAFIVSWVVMYMSGRLLAALVFGAIASLLGAFGHNWVHQPNYRLWSYLSLDTIGFSSTGWFREHVLQHHMYTNTPWDNHFRGTDPFLVTDPTVRRNWLQAKILPYLNPVILTFGLFANYGAHAVDMIKGLEEWRPTKLILPANVLAMIWRWGLVRGLLLSYSWSGLLGVWYFSMALMNHNAERCMDVKARNKARDWGEAQLVASADWSVQTPFYRAWPYLWLNFHTVHHVFPKLDFSHHYHAQQILLKTCAEYSVHYVAAESLFSIYKQMINSFATPRSLCESILVYGAT